MSVKIVKNAAVGRCHQTRNTDPDDGELVYPLLRERRDLTTNFHYPENSGDVTQNWQLKLDLSAGTVQEKNNPDNDFD